MWEPRHLRLLGDRLWRRDGRDGRGVARRRGAPRPGVSALEGAVGLARHGTSRASGTLERPPTLACWGSRGAEVLMRELRRAAPLLDRRGRGQRSRRRRDLRRLPHGASSRAAERRFGVARTLRTSVVDPLCCPHGERSSASPAADVRGAEDPSFPLMEPTDHVRARSVGRVGGRAWWSPIARTIRGRTSRSTATPCASMRAPPGPGILSDSVGHSC